METKNEHHGGSDDFVDPLSRLALLSRSARAPEYEAFLNFGPWWHAPIWATFVGSLSLATASLQENADVVGTSATGGVAVETFFDPLFTVITIITALVLTVDGLRRREVKPRPTLLGVALTALACVIAIATVVAWNIAIGVVGYQDFLFLWAAVGWVLTTGFFLGLRSFLSRLRNGQQVAAV